MTKQQTALVLGLGRFGGGAAAARFLATHGYLVRVADRSSGPDLDASKALLQGLPGIDFQLGREDEGVLDGVDLLVVNPGIPDQHPLLAAAQRRGIARTQEVNLFLEHYPGRVVAVTGTNGKSSTSTMLHAALSRAGFDTLLGGNIGHSLLDDEARWHKDQVAVLEISSFQLDRVDSARHRVFGAVLTRILKDHVDRHGTLEAYHRSKSVLPLLAESFCIHAADDPVACAMTTNAARFVYASTRPQPRSAGIDDGYLCVRIGDGEAERLVHEDALRMIGDFQRENALAAGLAVRLCGGSASSIGLALANVAPLPFRLQLLCTIDGVRIYDNAVSTEVESTRSALRNLKGRVHWVAGGKSKDGDYRTVAEATAPLVASAHVFGAAAEPLAAELRAAFRAQGRAVTVHARIQEALDAALLASAPGDALLFSPAFASFDQYPNFKARALEFHAWAAAKRSPRGIAAPIAATSDDA